MKHSRKYKLLTLPALVLSAALIFSACGQTTEQTTSGNTGSSAINLVSTGTGNSSVKTVLQADSSLYDESFSSRDLSGEYEESEAVTISLSGTGAEASSGSVQISGSTVTITAAGTYILSGTLNNGSVIVNADKEDKVQLVLDGVTIHSDSFAAIYVVQADKVFLTLAEGSVNTLSNGGTFSQIDDNNVDGVIFSKDDLTLNGSGTLTVTSPAGHGIVGKDEVTITGGTYQITTDGHAIAGKDSIAIADGSFILKTGKDGLHAENSDDETLGSIYIAGGDFVISVKDDAVHAETLLQIDGGTFSITAAEGLEATYIRINGGDIQISASDDGVNAARKSSAYTPTFEMNDGTLTVKMGSGDTDGIDSNGNIIINGGTINVTGSSTFDYDGTAQYNGGTIIVNGQQVNSIPNQMMGGMGGMGGMNGGNMNGETMGGGKRH
ncbi:MAG: carbohydrate-binding domain-containing protein [Clostridia bacterium]|nr:carbohydrate-binding domain-containing protein [Clostridia bacterium]